MVELTLGMTMADLDYGGDLLMQQKNYSTQILRVFLIRALQEAFP
jgi:hypothetical protein